MRTLPRVTIVAGLVLCLFGCKSHDGHGHETDGIHEGHGQETSSSHEQDGGHDDHGPTDGEHESHDSALQLTLDDGKKWPVDDSTRESSARLVEILGSTEAIETVDDARALGKALDEELDTLVKGCKMTGPAHDQLHVFLVALFPQVEALEKKTEIADLQSARSEIDTLFRAYSEHFE